MILLAVKVVVQITDTKVPQDDLKALEKFSKQLHMYTSEQLRSALKITIRMAKEAIEDRVMCEALVSGFDSKECLVMLAKDSGFQALPGDDVEMEVPCGDEDLKVYSAKVATVKGDRGEIFCLQDVSLQQPERRRAKRFPIYSRAEYCFPKDEEETIENGILLNISKTGLLLATAKPLLSGNALMIMFKINWGEIIGVPVGVIGTIVREQKNLTTTRLGEYNYCCGVRFNSPRRAA